MLSLEYIHQSDFNTAHNWIRVLPLIDPIFVDQFIENNCNLSKDVEQFKEDHDLTMCELCEMLLRIADSNQ